MKTIVAIVALMLSMQQLGSAQGKEIVIIDTVGTKTEGELMAVRSDAFILAREVGKTEKELQEHPELLLLVPKSTVLRIEIPGHSDVLLGVGIGALVGGILGVAIGASRVGEDEDPVRQAPQSLRRNAGIGALSGLVGGGLIGGLIGGAGASEERIVGPSSADSTLRILARYSDVEPEFLRNLPEAGD